MTGSVLEDLSPGDRLWIAPPIGRPYDATVTDTTPERVRVRFSAMLPTGEDTTRTRWLSAREVDEWHVRGDLLINPERPARA